jgi:glyoxylase-like metal-dependent hydrolase (beta-lactamase superfamily II)
MQQIADNVYIEDQFAGVTLGAINLPHGLIQIDAPPSMEDNRIWRASLLNLGGGVERILINLDAHPDRTLGARAMDCTVIAHEKTAQAFRNRPTAFKPQVEETGSDWEEFAGVGTVRWAPPEITFTERMEVEWSHTPVMLEHHPGPSLGAIWAHLPKQRILFVGDTVLKHQPPFLASASLPQWMEQLAALLSDDFRGYTIVSGRGGSVAPVTIKAQREVLERIRKGLERLAARHAAVDAVENLIPGLLNFIKVPASRQKQFAQRLRYGLRHYYARHYHRSEDSDKED